MNSPRSFTGFDNNEQKNIYMKNSDTLTRNLLSNCAVSMVRGYQMLLSPLFGGQCKYHPTCSQYAIGAFEKHGFFRGLAKTAWRILHCNPFSQGGIDFP